MGYYDDDTKKFSNREAERFFRTPMKDVVAKFRTLYGSVAFDPEDPQFRELRDAIDKLHYATLDH